MTTLLALLAISLISLGIVVAVLPGGNISSIPNPVLRFVAVVLALPGSFLVVNLSYMMLVGTYRLHGNHDLAAKEANMWRDDLINLPRDVVATIKGE